jgi:hypothetical protein
MITERPASGEEEPVLSRGGKTIPYRRQSVKLNFFSERYTIGYDRLSALYLFNGELIAVMAVYFS